MNQIRPLRVKIAAWILCGVFAVSVLSFCNVQHHCRLLCRQSERVSQLLESGAPDSDISAAIRILETEWEKDADMLGLALPGDILSDLNEAIRRLPALETDPDDLAAELLSISADFRRIRRQEMIVL